MAKKLEEYKGRFSAKHSIKSTLYPIESLVANFDDRQDDAYLAS